MEGLSFIGVCTGKGGYGVPGTWAPFAKRETSEGVFGRLIGGKGKEGNGICLNFEWGKLEIKTGIN